MDRIASFSIDHTILLPGIYVSRIDGDAVTYDVRMKRPNHGDYLSNGALHTIEHLFATYVRNSSDKDNIIYVGPMGCRTGFYLIVRAAVSRCRVLELVRESFLFISRYTGDIPGATESECGNYLEHDLCAAKAEAEKYYSVLEGCSESSMTYVS